MPSVVFGVYLFSFSGFTSTNLRIHTGPFCRCKNIGKIVIKLLQGRMVTQTVLGPVANILQCVMGQKIIKKID